MMSTIFTGSAVALVAPMHEDGSLDYKAYEVLCKKMIDNNVQALVVNGTTGEASTLKTAEELELIRIAKKVANGKAKIIAGTGSNETEYAVKATLHAQNEGVDAALIVTPYYNKTSQQGLLEHYLYIADNTNVPIILYNVPSRTGMTISVDVVAKLAKHPRIVGIKDATGDIGYTMQILAKTRGEDFAVYSGNDDNILPFMAAGGKGIISVVSNVYPREVELLTQLILKGDLDQARKLAYDLVDVSAYMFADVNPIMPKAALAKQGICGEALRRPLIPTTEDKKKLLYDAMDAFEALGY